MSDDTFAVGGEIAISRQLLNQSAFIPPTWLYGRNPTPEDRARWAAQQVARESDWDAKVAQGLVGIISDFAYDGEPVVYSLQTERGAYVEKWVTPEVWQRYIDARCELDAAEEALG